jgi:hypothetical protein
MQRVTWHRKIRNHLTHRSLESRVAFEGVVEQILTVKPSTIPRVHELLIQVPNRGPAKGRAVAIHLIDGLAVFSRGVRDFTP